MEIRKFPDNNSVNRAVSADEPLLAVVSFDGKSSLRINALKPFIRTDFLHSMGFLVGIDIPKRYRRHLSVLSNENDTIS